MRSNFNEFHKFEVSTLIENTKNLNILRKKLFFSKKKCTFTHVKEVISTLQSVTSDKNDF